MKIFFHNCTGEVFFTSKEEAKFIITEKKYSLLSKINPTMKINGKYEFLLEYPTGFSNQWRQSNSPLDEKEDLANGPYNVTGYEDVNVTMKEHFWGGLVVSTRPHTLLDGSVGYKDWFYSVGLVNPNDWAYSGHIPSNDLGVDSLYLWIKVNANIISCLFNMNTRCSHFFLFDSLFYIQYVIL
jgi:hypothetical protein